MQMTLAPPDRPAAGPHAVVGRHVAPVPPSRPRFRRTATVLVLVVGVAATAVALLLPGSAANRIDSALRQLRTWPSMSVTGSLAGDAGPVTVRATITADGAATGTVERPDGGRAEFAVGRGATLLRGDARWWRTAPPALVMQLAHRWITQPREEAVDLIAAGELGPVAVADALAALRVPDGRTEAETVADGVRGTAFTRAGVRLVIAGDGRPLAVDLPPSTGGATSPGTAIAFRPPHRTAPPAAGVSIVVAAPGPAEEAAARRAVTDVLAQLGAESPADLPARDDLEQPAWMESPVAVDVAPEPGCRRSGCSVRVDLANSSSLPRTGLFVLMVADVTVRADTLTLRPRTTTTLTIELPPSALAAAHERAFTARASFEMGAGAAAGPGATGTSAVGDRPTDTVAVRSRVAGSGPR
jgi:hypothetical protein